MSVKGSGKSKKAEIWWFSMDHQGKRTLRKADPKALAQRNVATVMRRIEDLLDSMVSHQEREKPSSHENRQGGTEVWE